MIISRDWTENGPMLDRDRPVQVEETEEFFLDFIFCSFCNVNFAKIDQFGIF